MKNFIHLSFYRVIMCVNVVKVNNVKIHFSFFKKLCRLSLQVKRLSEKVEAESTLGERLTLKRNVNLWILRDRACRYVYVMFPEDNLVNVTGIPNLSSMGRAVYHLCKLLNLSKDYIDPLSLKIDNVTSSGRVTTSVNLPSLHRFLLERERTLYTSNNSTIAAYSVIHQRSQFNPDFFPGLTIRFATFPNNEKLGTVVIFHTGRFNVVGVTSTDQIRQVVEELCVTMREAQMITTPVMSSAWIVE